MFFMGARSGELFSEFRIPRTSQNPGAGGYCSSHLGNVVPARGRYLLANAYYLAGSSVIDFTDVRNPREVAYGDRTGAGTWSAYWFEPTDRQTGPLDVYSNDGVHNAPEDRNGFEAWAVTIGDLRRTGLPFLNPQTQEQVVKSGIELDSRGAAATASGTQTNLGRFAAGREATRGPRINRQVFDHLATP
jgi:hypothetical protein